MPPIRRPSLRLGWPRPNPILDALIASNKSLCREVLQVIPEVTNPHVVAGFVSLSKAYLLTMELDGSRLHDFIKSSYSQHRQSANHRTAVVNVAHDCIKDYFARYVF